MDAMVLPSRRLNKYPRLGEINVDYNDYNEKTVLVTGGAGCVGSNLTWKLSEYAEKVIILDNLDSAYEWNIPEAENINFVKGDILDDEMLKRVFKEKPDYVFHLAAHFANQNSVDNPELDLMVNGMGILKVLQYAHLVEVERFVYSSSGCGVYVLDSKMPLKNTIFPLAYILLTKSLNSLESFILIISTIFMIYQLLMPVSSTCSAREKYPGNTEM